MSHNGARIGTAQEEMAGPYPAHLLPSALSMWTLMTRHVPPHSPEQSNTDNVREDLRSVMKAGARPDRHEDRGNSGGTKRVYRV